MAKEKKKIKIPESIYELRWDMKKYAKKNSLRYKGKGMKKKERKEAERKLFRAYAMSTIKNLNKAVKILSENPVDSKKMIKVRKGVDNIISNAEIMKRIAKYYNKNRKEYPNLIYLPYMITNTLRYYSHEGIPEEEKAEANRLDKIALLTFCEKILKKQIKHYRDAGFNDNVAFELANVIPTTKLLTNGGRQWYKNLLRKLYDVAEFENIDLTLVLSSVPKVAGKKNKMKKSEFLNGFFSEFILTKSSNKSLTYNDTQKELHENLIDASLVYLDSLREKELREIMKTYIKRRKTAESYKNDTKRVLKFTDHANSNSKYTKLKTVVQDLISANSNNEIYLS